MLGIREPYRMPNRDILPEMYERWTLHDVKLTRASVRLMVEEWLENMAENEPALREAIMEEIALATGTQ